MSIFPILAIMNKVKYLLILIVIFSLSACAYHYTDVTYSDPYGFFSGIWHGFIFPFSLLANIISWELSLIGIDELEQIQIIGRPNTGFLFYYVGFFFGVSVWGARG